MTKQFFTLSRGVWFFFLMYPHRGISQKCHSLFGFTCQRTCLAAVVVLYRIPKWKHVRLLSQVLYFFCLCVFELHFGVVILSFIQFFFFFFQHTPRMSVEVLSCAGHLNVKGFSWGNRTSIVRSWRRFWKDSSELKFRHLGAHLQFWRNFSGEGRNVFRFARTGPFAST